MATSRGPILAEKEEKQLNKLRQRLFESKWDSAEFKASVRDLVSAKHNVMYTSTVHVASASAAPLAVT